MTNIIPGPRTASTRRRGAHPRGPDPVPGPSPRGTRTRSHQHGAALPREQARRARARAAAPQDHRGEEGVHREAEHCAGGGGAQVKQYL